MNKTEPCCLVGIGGAAGAGKDSLADALVSEFSFTKIAFADPLREMAVAINPIIDVKQCWGGTVFVRYNDALADVGYDRAKFVYPEIRSYLQRLGTDAGRKVLGDSLWTDVAMSRVVGLPKVVIADLRFRNEARAIRSRGGLTIQIVRPGVGAANDHVSEHDLASWPFSDFVANDGTLEDLKVEARIFVEKRFPWILR